MLQGNVKEMPAYFDVQSINDRAAKSLDREHQPVKNVRNCNVLRVRRHCHM
jgi:hypothetical protein